MHVDLKLTQRLDELAAALGRHGLLGRTVASGVHRESLAALARAAPSIRVGFTYPEDRRGISRRRILHPAIRLGTVALRAALARRVAAMLARAGANALMLHHAVVSPEAVAAAHAAGAAVWSWTIDRPEELAAMEAAGVDAVITNDPRILRAAATLPA